MLDPADPPLPFTSAQSHYHMGGASSSYGYGGSSASKSAGPHTHASRYSSRMPYEDDIKEEEPGFQRSEMCISSYEPQQSAVTMKRGGPSGSYPGNLPKRKERTMYQYMNSRVSQYVSVIDFSNMRYSSLMGRLLRVMLAAEKVFLQRRRRKTRLLQ